ALSGYRGESQVFAPQCFDIGIKRQTPPTFAASARPRTPTTDFTEHTDIWNSQSVNSVPSVVDSARAPFARRISPATRHFFATTRLPKNRSRPPSAGEPRDSTTCTKHYTIVLAHSSHS